MLLEFTVKNFLSIRDTQTFSLVASSDDTLANTNVIEATKGCPALVRAAAIFGANASGKSTLFKSIKFSSDYILQGSKVGESIHHSPFLLDVECHDEPTEFEFVFIHNEVRYQYGYSVTNTEVISEWLFEYPEGRPRELFQRNHQQFKFGNYFKGQKKLIESSTRANTLFLTTGSQLNNPQLLAVYEFFSRMLYFTAKHNEHTLLLSKFTADKSEDEEEKKRISNFIKAADVGIENFYIKKSDSNEQDDVDSENKDNSKALFLHEVQGAEYFAAFDFEMESDGTQNIFVLAGLWLDVLDTGGVLVVDELEISLHPHLVHFLIKMFLSKRTNPNNAQLIFTTHESTVMKKGLLRRDQIWFVEKNKESASELVPLTDFSPRKGEAIQKAYLEGKFGAVPFLGDYSNGF